MVKMNIKLIGGYTNDSAAIVMFFKAIDRFSEKQLGKFLQFTTGSAHVPLDGWDPQLTIAKLEIDEDYLPLPRAHTCFNRLVLPNYTSYPILLEKLLQAIENYEGFQLT